MANVAGGAKFVVRPFRPGPGGDRDGVLAIFYLTGLFGDPVARYFPAPGFLSEALVEYYLHWERQWLLVAEDAASGRVAGYILGCPDTARRDRRTVWWLFPRLVIATFKHGLIWRGELWRLVLARLRDKLAAPTRSSADGRLDLETYPAHLHMAVHPDFHRRGIGRRLLNDLCDRLAAAGIPGIHLHTTNRHQAAIAMYQRDGFRVLSSQTTYMFDHLLPPAMLPVENIVMIKDLRPQAGAQGGTT